METEETTIDPIEKYYNYLKAQNADVPSSVDSFKSTLQDPAAAQKYYNYVKGLGLDAPDTFESFANTLGIKKKSADWALPSTSSLLAPKEPLIAGLPSTGQTDDSTGSLSDSSTQTLPPNPAKPTDSYNFFMKQLTPEERQGVLDRYAKQPGADPAIYNTDGSAKYSFGKYAANEPEWLKRGDEWVNKYINDPVSHPTEAFFHNRIWMPVYQGTVGLTDKILAGAGDMLNDASHMGYANFFPDSIRQFLDQNVENDKNMPTIGKKDDSIAGDVTEGVASALPMIAALPENAAASASVEVPELANNFLARNPYLQTAYKFITSPIVKLFAGEEAANAYHESSAAGNDIATNLTSAAAGATEGAENAMSLEAQTLVGGALGGKVAEALAEKGLLKGGKTTEAILHALGIGTVFGGSSAATDIINGEDPETVQRHALVQMLVGASFGVPEAIGKIMEGVEDKKANDNIVKTGLLAKNVQDLSNSAIVTNLMGFDIDQVRQINDSPATPDQLYEASLQVGAKAYDETDPQTKRDLMIQQLSLKNQGDIKRATEKIINNHVEFANAILDSGLPPDDQLNLLDKITAINKNFNPVELEKTDLGRNINQVNGQIKQTQEAIKNTEAPEDKFSHYVALNDLIGKRVEAQTRLWDLNAEQARKINEQQENKAAIQGEQEEAHANIQHSDNPLDAMPYSIKVGDEVISGANEAEVRSKIDAHFDDRLRELNNPPAPAPETEPIAKPLESQQEQAAPSAQEEPAAGSEPNSPRGENGNDEAAIKPHSFENDVVGKSEIIGYKDDGTITIKTAEGETADITPAERHIIGIKASDIDEFKKLNGVKESEPEHTEGSIDQRIDDLAKRIHAKDDEFSDADQKLFTQHQEKIAGAVGKLQASEPVNESLNIPNEGERAERKAEYKSNLEGELDELRHGQKTVSGLSRRVAANEGRNVKDASDWMKKLTSPFTPERVTEAKSKLVDIQKIYKENKRQLQVSLPRERGANFLVEKLSRAARNGDISQEHADLAIDLVRRNPELFKDLAISITHASDRADAAGWYRTADALVKVLKGSDDLTATHELLHHTERFMPEDVRSGILKEWHDQIQRQKKSILAELKDEKDPDRRYKLTTALQYLGLAEQRQLETNPVNQADMERIMKKYLKEDLGSSFYQLFNPSEWWAVNASEKFRDLQNKPEANTWVQKAREWYQGLLKGIKNVLGLNHTQNVERGLNAVLKGDVLDEMKGTQLSGAEKLFNLNDEEKRPQRLPGEPIRDYVDRVNDFNRRKKEAEDNDRPIAPPREDPPTYIRTIEYPEPRWSLPDETKEELAKRKVKDYLNRQETVQRAIEMAGGSINDRTDFHTAADLQGSRVNHHVNELYERMIKSPDKDNPAFFERLKRDGFTHQELDDFVRAQHVEEYNREVGNRRRAQYQSELDRLEARRQDAVRDKKDSTAMYYEDAIKKLIDQSPDKNGKIKNELMDDGAAGMTNAEAATILDKFKRDGKYDALKKYGDEFVKEVSNRQLDFQVESGTIDKDTADDLKSKYSNYVPFHVEEFLQEKPGKPVRKNFSNKLSSVDNIIRRAKGSVERTADQRVSPTSYGMVQLERAYHEGEVNKSSNILYNLVEQNPNDSVFEIVHPKFSPIYRKDGTVNGFREITDDGIKKNSLQLYRDGKKVYIHIKDPILRDAIARNGVVKSFRFLGNVQNVIRTAATELNPPFWITNTVKHMVFAGFNLSTEGKTNIAKDMLKNSIPATRAAFQWTHGTRNGDWAPYIERYQSVGGKLSGIAPASDLQKMDSFKKAIESIGQKKNVAQNTKKILKYVATFGDASGTGPRLAIFRSAVENGMTDMQAAKLSREASINFNKKGEWSGFANNLYLMFNAHAQSAISVLEKRNNPLARKLFAGAFAIGIMNYALNHSLSNDKDNPVSEYEKQNNILFKIPRTDGYLKIPIYSELAVPYYMGGKVFETLAGISKPGEATLDVFSNALTSFAPLHNGDMLQLVTPTVALPLVQYKENKNTFGSPIYKDPNDAKISTPSSHTHFGGTSPEFVKMAQGLNYMTGGNGVKSGYLDFSPDVMQWLYTTATNGAGKTVQETGEIGYNGYEHAKQALGLAPSNLQISPLEVKNIPLLKSFYTEGNPLNYQSKMYDILRRSGNNEIDSSEAQDFYQAAGAAFSHGKITGKQYQQYVKEFMDNQVRIQWGNMMPDAEAKDINAMKNKH